jgi:hypothetical protein
VEPEATIAAIPSASDGAALRVRLSAPARLDRQPRELQSGADALDWRGDAAAGEEPRQRPAAFEATPCRLGSHSEGWHDGLARAT